jgi:glutamate synthase (NADPH/NADH) large chain
VLADWAHYRARFVKVFPNEYRRALKEMSGRTAEKRQEAA